MRKLYPIILILCLLISGCFDTMPNDPANVCSIFEQNPSWYWDAQRAQKRWGVPTSILMAIMYQESRFQPTVKPPRGRLLWVIPWSRPTTADGFAQVTNETWWRYQNATDNFAARRSKFKDAIDFVGWYSYQAHRKDGIRLNDAYALYLSYHDGVGGYRDRYYLRQRWLRNIAWGVKRRADIYHQQLVRCGSQLEQRPWW